MTCKVNEKVAKPVHYMFNASEETLVSLNKAYVQVQSSNKKLVFSED